MATETPTRSRRPGLTTVQLDPDQLESLADLAVQLRTSRSSLIRQALDHYIPILEADNRVARRLVNERGADR